MATCGSFLSLYIWKLAAIVMIEKLIISPLMCPDISFVSFITLKIFLIVLSRNYFGNEVEHILEVRFRIPPNCKQCRGGRPQVTRLQRVSLRSFLSFITAPCEMINAS